MTDIALSATQRSNLLSLQHTQDLSERTQLRLATGKRVNQVSDDPVAFFRARVLVDRADDFTTRRDNINQGNIGLNATLDGIEAVSSLLLQLRGITEAARSQSTLERVNTTGVFRTLLVQLNEIVEDASYQGLNLLNNTAHVLNVSFGVRTRSRLLITGYELGATTVRANGGLFTVIGWSGANKSVGVVSTFLVNSIQNVGFSRIGNDNSFIAVIENSINVIDSAVSRLRGYAATIGSNASILQTRLSFTSSYTNNLRTGSDALVLADLNEEGANIVVLSTRQQLGVQALRVSGQQQAAVLSLIQ